MVFSKQQPVLAVQYERKLMLARITKAPNKEACSHEWALRAKVEHDPKGLWKTTTRGTDMSTITPEHVAWVENKLNNRPRKKLNYLTPNEALANHLLRLKVMH